MTDRCCWGRHPPFFPAWSSQFSKVQGPQAPQGDTWQSMGQGTWQSCEVLGTGPWHSRFSTGRDAAGVEQENRSQVRHRWKAKTCFAFILFRFRGITTEGVVGNSRVRGRGDGLFVFIPGSSHPCRDLSSKVVEEAGKKKSPPKKQHQQNRAVPLFGACRNDELAPIILPRLTTPC